MDNPRTLLAIALSFLVLLIWQAWMKDYGSQPKPQPQTVEQPAETRAPSVAEGGEDLPVAPADQPPAAAQETVAVQLPEGQRIEVVTDLFRAVIDTHGGDLREVDLLKYPLSTKKDSGPFRLLEESPNLIFVAQSGLRVGKGKGAEPTHYASFQVDRNSFELKPGSDVLEVPLRWTNDNGIEVTKLYRFRRDSYVIEVEFQIRNNSDSDWTARPYYQLQRTPPVKKQRFLYTYTGGVLYSPEDKYQKIKFKAMQEANLSRAVKDGWAAMIQHYFVAAWVPPLEQTEHYYTRALKGERYVIGLIGPSVNVTAGSDQTTSAELYVGPKLQHIMKAVAPGLELTVDYGVLTILAQPIFWLLEHIHALVGNWGWSIIFLTMLIKAAFFKLSETSYKSMANMRKLAPRLKALKERYGDDKQKLNQAMMDMYKKQKVNPLGGCLPVLVQIPVFISLYWVLLESVEMRQAPFMLWIQNLSAPDPYYILPLIMGATMLIQQKLNPAPMDPMQAKVMMILPVVFTVFFAFFPSGLVLYWVVNNTLSIAQQYVITKRVEAAG
ncbi:MAG TPA: membrane protein insertase YidC [Gammaproteobacteria bacterium]|nr:membrane protein insertase YidC [Gammaproteobacteria bacterium]